MAYLIVFLIYRVFHTTIHFILDLQEEMVQQQFELEKKKVKALEKIANSLDSLTIWFEEIDKDEWGDRIQYYLAEFHNKFVKDEE